MTTFIKTKSKISDDETKYRLAANITEYHIISKLILQIGLTIRRTFGSDADSDFYKNPFKKNPGFSTDFGFLEF